MPKLLGVHDCCSMILLRWLSQNGFHGVWLGTQHKRFLHVSTRFQHYLEDGFQAELELLGFCKVPSLDEICGC